MKLLLLPVGRIGKNSNSRRSARVAKNCELGLAVTQGALHALQAFLQQRPWAAEVKAHELLAVVTEFDPCAQADLGLFQEKLLRVIQAQRAAIQPGQEGALRRVHDHAGQAGLTASSR